MKVQDVIKLNCFYCIVFVNQVFHVAVNFFWFGGFFSAYFVGKVLVIANGKPRLVAVGSICFQDWMQLFYVSFAYSLCCMVYDIVDTTKMIDCFYDVIDRSTLGSYGRWCWSRRCNVSVLLWDDCLRYDWNCRLNQSVCDDRCLRSTLLLSRLSIERAKDLALWGSGASEGIFHVFPVRNAPSIFPSAQ